MTDIATRSQAFTPVSDAVTAGRVTVELLADVELDDLEAVRLVSGAGPPEAAS